eukprot:3844365-Rhodomonas_salina.5
MVSQGQVAATRQYRTWRRRGVGRYRLLRPRRPVGPYSAGTRSGALSSPGVRHTLRQYRALPIGRDWRRTSARDRDHLQYRWLCQYRTLHRKGAGRSQSVPDIA